MARARYKRGSTQNRIGMLLATISVSLLLVVVAVKSVGLLQKQGEYQSRIETLQAQIKDEEKRSEDIAQFETYTTTRKYIEEVAKEKLGLVYPGEIIFKDGGSGK